MKNILAIDVGTTALKMGVFNSDLRSVCHSTRNYEINVYDRGKADIEAEKWWIALKSSCEELKPHLDNVGLISFSVTTPGLVPMAEDGTALGPAILFFDQRSQQQAKRIRKQVGEDYFIREANNLPVSGGSSLCSMLWIKDNQPKIWEKTNKFGHTNTYMVKRFTGKWAIDPSTMSITGLYHTRLNNLQWLENVLEKAEIPVEKLPPLKHSHQAVGQILPEVAAELGLPDDCIVLCGGNDAVLASLSAGLVKTGSIIDVAGTCEIMQVCCDRPIGSPNYNIRTHVLPNRWLTFFVLNTGGKALEWFYSVFCRDMTVKNFYSDFLPKTIEKFLENSNTNESGLPEYVPYLQGSRYSLDNLTAAFSNINLETTRENMLLGLLRGNFSYLGGHLNETAQFIKLRKEIITTGGGAGIQGINDLKKRWLGDFDYKYQDQSSLLGAAMLGKMYFDEQTSSQESRGGKP